MATANLQTWIRAVLFETPASPTQFPCLLSAIPVLVPCSIYAKSHCAWVDEDPRWCQSWSHDGQSSLSSPLVRASPGPVLCWHPGPSPGCPSPAFTLGALQSVLLQPVVLPCQSGCSSCIATVSEKKELSFGPPQSSMTAPTEQHGAKRHEEDQAKINVFLIPASSCPFCSQYTEKCKIAAMWRGFPCSLGKSSNEEAIFCLSSRTRVWTGLDSIGIYFSLLSAGVCNLKPAEPWPQ